jgi:hypothetical protein
MRNLKLHLFVIICSLVSLCSTALATPPSITFGQITTGTVSSPTQTNRYTLAASGGDVLDFTMQRTSGSLSPQVQLYNSTGTQLFSVSDGYCDGSLIQKNLYTVPATDTYTVILGDCSNTLTGSYLLYVDRMDNPPGSVNLPLSQPQTGSIAAAPELNSYTFTASQGDIYDFTMLATSGSLSPYLQLFNSGGTQITTDSNGYCDGAGLDMNQITIPATGTYTLFLGDCSTWYTGNYVIYAQKVDSPPPSADIVWDETQTGAIAVQAQRNIYAISADANDEATFTITTTKGNLSPKLQLFDSVGNLLLSDNNGYCDGATVTTSQFKFPATGTYTLFANDCSDWDTGNYTLSTQCFGTCPLPAPTLASLSSTSALVGSSGFTLTANGSNFAEANANSVVQWNGNPLVTTWVSLTQMTAAVLASDLNTAGCYPVTVFTPTPGGGTSSPISFCVNNPQPALTSISPTSTTAPGASFPLTLTGTNFIPSSSVKWNGSSLATTYGSATQLTASVPASDLLTAGTASLTVFNPTPGGGSSAPKTFTIDNPVPGAITLSPTNVLWGGSAFTLTVNGSNFVPTSSVQWNGSGLATTYVSATELQATVPAGDITSSGSASVTVYNPPPGGGTSAPVPFIIGPPAATPTFSVAGGTYSSTFLVSISDTTPGAVIHYTTSVGGTTPTATSPVFGAPIDVEATVTIEAIAVATGYSPSAVASATYTINFPASQTINFPAIPTQIALTSVGLSATSTSGLAVTFASTTPTYCTVSGSTAMPILANGTCTIEATQAGNSNYSAAPAVYRSFWVNHATQTITFPAVPTQVAATSVGLTATASSGLTVTYASTTPTICSVAGATASSLLSGNCIIQATQAGNSAYGPAPAVSSAFWVNHAAQTITFPAVPTQVAATSVGLTATASSGLTVTYTSTTPTVCSVAGATASSLLSGTCTIQATQPGNGAYTAAPAVSRAFWVNHATQTITFPAIATQIAVTSVGLTATASSGLAVTYTSTTPTVCSVSGTTASTLISGSCIIQATQTGNSAYAPAPPVNLAFWVNHATQTITFPAIATPQVALTSVGLTATASSGLTVTYTSTTPTVCTVAGATASSLLSGTCVIQATQAGNSAYVAAPAVNLSFWINHATQTITFPAIATQVALTSVGLSATASSGLAVMYTSTTPTVCSVSGTTASTLISGTCTIQATQPGNGAYGAAAPVSSSFWVNHATQTITFPNPGPQTGVPSLSLSATATSGLAVSFASTTPTVCTVAASASTASLLINGTCTIQATQTGNTAYGPAPAVNQSFTVSAP